MARSSGLRAGALLAFVLAEGVAAHPRPETKPIDVRLVGATEDATRDDYEHGKQLLAADDLVGALAAFRAALSAAPDSADAMNGVGVAYDRLGRTDLARRFYEAGLAIDPTSPALLNNLGYSLFLSGDRAAAIAPLRAAAASADPDAAATAQATLARLAADPRGERPEAAEAPSATAQAVGRIELTSDGEQRLTFAPPAPASDVVAALGEDAASVVVAAAWSDADDAAMIARVRAEEAAENAVLAAARTVDPSPPATSATADAAVADLPKPSAPTGSVRRADPRNVRTAPSLILAAADSTSRRRVRATGGAVETALGSGPQPRAAAAFDSDDDELNAFAARVKAIAPSATAAPGERGRIAARFRA